MGDEGSVEIHLGTENDVRKHGFGAYAPMTQRY